MNILTVGHRSAKVLKVFPCPLGIMNRKLYVQRTMFCEKKTNVDKVREASEYFADMISVNNL